MHNFLELNYNFFGLCLIDRGICILLKTYSSIDITRNVQGRLHRILIQLPFWYLGLAGKQKRRPLKRNCMGHDFFFSYMIKAVGPWWKPQELQKRNRENFLGRCTGIHTDIAPHGTEHHRKTCEDLVLSPRIQCWD